MSQEEEEEEGECESELCILGLLVIAVRAVATLLCSECAHGPTSNVGVSIYIYIRPSSAHVIQIRQIYCLL